MSSMVRKSLLFLALSGASALALTSPVHAEDNTMKVTYQPSAAGRAVSQWEYLVASDKLGFSDYADFLLKNPGFPKEGLLRTRAENTLENEAPSSRELVQYFDRNPPQTNSGRARYALALAAVQRPEAFEIARKAWRDGSMSSSAEAYLMGLYGARFTADDHIARMDALLWHGDKEAAARQIVNVPAANRALFMSRLALVQKTAPESAGVMVPADAMSDPGYVFNKVQYHRSTGNLPAAVTTLATRPKFATPAHDTEDFVAEMLAVAKGAGSSQAVAIASSVDDLFAPGTDISDGSYR